MKVAATLRHATLSITHRALKSRYCTLTTMSELKNRQPKLRVAVEGCVSYFNLPAISFWTMIILPI